MPRAPKTNTIPKPTTTRLSTPVASAPESASKKTLSVVVILAVLLVMALSVAGYFYYQSRQVTQVQAAKEIRSITEEIGAVFQLPEGEEPTLATVTDKDKLLDQPFFQKAENGDKVLIYSSTGRAILYRPSVKKIIDVTSINVSESTATVPAETTVVPPTPSEPQEVTSEPVPVIVRIALYNGSETLGVTNAVESKLKPILPNAAVVIKEAAKKNDYATTLVIDVTGKNAVAASTIASGLKGTVGSLPEGEKTPVDTDILVIVGNDQ